MKHVLVIALVALAAGATAADEPQMSQRDQERLDRVLAGRTAGTSVSCVRQPDLRGNQSFGESVIMFEGRGDIVWINRPAGGCPTMNMGRSLVTRTTTTQLCRGDIVSVVDPVSGVQFGGCGLGDFVPYRRDRAGGM